MCDRALIIHEGRLIADGSPEALKASTERGSLEDVFRQLTHTEGARERSPFDPGFAPMHFLPHLLGGTIIITCAFPALGNDYKGIWPFGVVPDASLRPFVRGIHAGLWSHLNPAATGPLFRRAHARP